MLLQVDFICYFELSYIIDIPEVGLRDNRDPMNLWTRVSALNLEALAPATAAHYKINFNLFLKYVHIADLQVLLDRGPSTIEALVIDCVKYLRDVK